MKYRKLDILALCDREEEYIQSFAEYVKRYKNLPWELHVLHRPGGTDARGRE